MIITFIEKFMCRITDHFIAAGISVRDELVDSGIGTTDQYSIVKPGIPFENNIEKNEARKQLGITNDGVVIGWMGRFEPIKSPRRVIEIAEVFPEVTFIMAGNGGLFDRIKFEAPKNLVLPGWSDPRQIWSASDIALLTSENEALPIALIEAGLAGIPAVAEDVGAVSEVITHYQTGFLCKSFEDRREAIMLLVENNDLRVTMGENARNYTLSQFNPKKFVEDHIEIYKRTVAK